MLKGLFASKMLTEEGDFLLLESGDEILL